MSASQPKNLADVEALLEKYLVKKAPSLPPNLKEAIVKFGPYVALILIILSLPLVLGAFGLSALFAPLSFLGGVGTGVGFSLGILLTFVTLVLEVIALPGLFKRQLSAWRLMFYATLVSGVSSLLQGSLVGMLVGLLIGLYVLFQIKSYYH